MATGCSKLRHILRTESKLIWDSILQFTLFSSFGYHNSANSEAAMGILTHCWSVLMSHRKRLSGVCMDLKLLAFCPFSSLTVKTCTFMLPHCVTPRCFQVSLVPQFESCVSGLWRTAWRNGSCVVWDSTCSQNLCGLIEPVLKASTSQFYKQRHLKSINQLHNICYFKSAKNDGIFLDSREEAKQRRYSSCNLNERWLVS